MVGTGKHLSIQHHRVQFTGSEPAEREDHFESMIFLKP